MKDERKKALLVFAALSWPFYLNDFYLIPLTRQKDTAGLLWTLDVLIYALVPTITLIVLYKNGRLDFLKSAFAMPKRPWLVPFAAVGLAFLTHAVFTHGLDRWFMKHNLCHLCIEYSAPADPLGALFVAFYAPLSAGILEEVIFRGVLIDLLKKYTVNPVVIIISCAAIFAGIHWCGGTGKLAATFLAGLIPAAIYWRTGNLWLPILWHTLHDAGAFYNG